MIEDLLKIMQHPQFSFGAFKVYFVLRYIYNGTFDNVTDDEIAKLLNISPETVRHGLTSLRKGGYVIERHIK